MSNARLLSGCPTCDWHGPAMPCTAEREFLDLHRAMHDVGRVVRHSMVTHRREIFTIICVICALDVAAGLAGWLG